MATAQPIVNKSSLRWLIKSDLPAVLRIEFEASMRPWSEDDFLLRLRKASVGNMVVMYQDRVVGFMVYEIEKHSLRLLRLATDPQFQLMGVGRAMVERLVSKLVQQQRERIDVLVPELSGAQFFFAKLGFKAVCVCHECFDDSPDEDGFLMRYSIGAESAAVATNRIEGLV